MADYIPAPDADFDAWQKVLIKFIQDNQTALGVSDAALAGLVAEQGNWTGAFATHQAT